MTPPPDLHARVWRLDLVAAATALAEFEAEIPRLADDEYARAAGMSDPASARRWLAAHIGLRLVLERELGVDVRRIPYARTASGKPHLLDALLDFSLSHSRQHALIAITQAGSVGVDIEEPRQPRMTDDRRSAIIAAAASLNGQPLPADAEGAFLQAWVRLEALAKAEGLGLAAVLQRAGAFGPGRKLVTASAVDVSVAHLTVSDLLLGPGLHAAIAMPSNCTGAHVGDMPADRDGLRVFVLGR